MYVKISNQSIVEYPYSLYTLRIENPRTSFPDNIETDFASLAEYGVYRVFTTVPPSFDPQIQKLVENAPQYIVDRWVQSWSVVDLNETELSVIYETHATSARNERNSKLLASDWTQVADAPVNRVAWAEYRQQLRDISNEEGFPFNITWPSPPTSTTP